MVGIGLHNITQITPYTFNWGFPRGFPLLLKQTIELDLLCSTKHHPIFKPTTADNLESRVFFHFNVVSAVMFSVACDIY